MASKKHTNTSPQEKAGKPSPSGESPRANEKTTAWFLKLMSMSIWEKEDAGPPDERAVDKESPGHRDPTADAAIANVMREENRKSSIRGRKEDTDD